MGIEVNYTKNTLIESDTPPIASRSERQDSYFRYDRHKEEYQAYLSDPDRIKLAETWFKTDTLDAWRHARMHEPLKAIINVDAESSWLTIGDGRYGTDANFLLKSGAKKVHCTDISDALLKIGSEQGFITTYSAENAEDLRFEDNAFDYVYCKEALHHFPRPYAALYEMFRVAKKGIILTEPRDDEIESNAIRALKRIVKTVIGRGPGHSHCFEPVGNYIYSISEREIEKFLLGMHYTNVAYIGCNDAYEQGVEFVPMGSRVAKDIEVRTRIFNSIKRQDLYCRLHLKKTALLTAALFKSDLSESLKVALTQVGWKIKKLPSNPYA